MARIDINNPFQINLPLGWEDQTVYVFRGPEEDGRDHNLMLMVDRHLQHNDVSAYGRERMQPIIDALQGVETLKEEDVTLERGNPVYEYVYKWVPCDGYIAFQRYVFVFKNGMGFTFSIGFSKKSLKLLNSQVNKIIETLLPGTFEPLED